jgi:hypothetical protein
MMTVKATRRVYRNMGFEEFLVDSEPQYVFAQLFRKCLEQRWPDFFRSDLYYDAIFLQKNWEDIKRQGYFFWSLRSTGTHIGIDDTSVAHDKRYSRDAICYVCILPSVTDRD